MKHHVGVSLLQTNRQICDEAAPVLYTGNKFLFTHPSDCNVFRVVASPHAESINSVYFRIREKDLRLWTTYLGSRSADRSLKADLPNLKNLWIFMRCGTGTPRILNTLGVQGLPGAAHAFGGVGALPHGMALHVQHVQNALGQQVAALQHQVQHLAHAVGVAGPPIIVPAGANPGQHHPAPQPDQAAAGDGDASTPAQHHVPPPPPPPPAMPFAAFAAGGAVPHHQPLPPAPAAATGHAGHHILANFLRFERELGIESLCLSLRETLQDPDHVFAHHTPSHPASAGGHRERRREDREVAARTELPHREERALERERDRRSEQTSQQSQQQQQQNQSTNEKKRKDPPDVKIVCIMRVPKPDVSRLVRMYPEELSVDRNGDARTRFRKLHGADICVEISGFEGAVVAG